MSNTPPPNTPPEDTLNEMFDETVSEPVTSESIPKDLPKDLEALTEEELLKKAIEYRDLSQRLAADYQNLQRDTDRRLADVRKYAVENLIMEIAPIVDYFDSAFAAVPEADRDSNWMKGIKYIQDHLMNVLKQNNVTLIETVGHDFDPNLHEAVGEEDSDAKPHSIIKQVQAGFTLNDKVIKHAKVITAKEVETQ